jgi:hypothetical protein
MAIRIECPRCHTCLQVPNKLAGGYVNCAHCQGRLWVPKDAPGDATRADAVTMATAGSAPIPGPTIPLRPGVLSPPQTVTPPPPPAPPKRIARFITAEAADSTLHLAADGRLPELHLEEGKSKETPEAKSRSVNPLVLLGVLSMSVVLSIVLVLVDWEPPSDSASPQKVQMRQMIEEEYFGAGTIDAKGLEPYQLLLRESQRASTRGDYKTEREQYRQVLDMLRTERGIHEKGLTGSRSRDEKLKNAISILLN